MTQWQQWGLIVFGAVVTCGVVIELSEIARLLRQIHGGIIQLVLTSQEIEKRLITLEPEAKRRHGEDA